MESSHSRRSVGLRWRFIDQMITTKKMTIPTMISNAITVAAQTTRAGAGATRRRDLPAQRRALDAADERRAHAVDRPGELGAHEPLRSCVEDGAELEPREVRAEADVLAAPEADVVVRVAVDPEHVAVGKISSSRFADG